MEELTEQFVTLEVARGVKIKFLRNQVAGSAKALATPTTATKK